MRSENRHFELRMSSYTQTNDSIHPLFSTGLPSDFKTNTLLKAISNEQEATEVEPPHAAPALHADIVRASEAVFAPASALVASAAAPAVQAQSSSAAAWRTTSRHAIHKRTMQKAEKRLASAAPYSAKSQSQKQPAAAAAAAASNTIAADTELNELGLMMHLWTPK